MGGYSAGWVGCGFFGIGVMMAFFHWRGITPALMDWLKSWANMWQISFKVHTVFASLHCRLIPHREYKAVVHRAVCLFAHCAYPVPPGRMAGLSWPSSYQWSLAVCTRSLITSAKEVMFLPVFVCLFVCLSVCLCVSKITQKVMDGSFWNFEWMSGVA